MATELLSNNPVGFRFHPTDVELVTDYLKPRILGRPFYADAIAEVELCQSEPWELPEKSKIKSKDKVWWFLCRRDYKSSSSKRVKRTTNTGFWKITGQERMIKDEDTKQCLGRKRTLVFHSGTAPGKRTNWVMQEIYLDPSTFTFPHHQMDAYVICKLKRKTDESAETPEGEIHQIANSRRESSCSEEEGEPDCGRITQEDIFDMLHDSGPFSESPEAQFVNSLLCDPDDPSIPHTPLKRSYFTDAPDGSDTDAEGTNGWQFQGSGSFDSSAGGSKKVRHFRMSKTPTETLQASVKNPHFTREHSVVPVFETDAVDLVEVGPAHVTVTRGGTRQKRVQFQNTATSDKAEEASKHVAGKEICVGEAGDDKKAVEKSAKSCKSSGNASKSWSFFDVVDSSSLSICESRSPYEYCLNMVVGTVLFAVFVRELVVFGGW